MNCIWSLALTSELQNVQEKRSKKLCGSQSKIDISVWNDKQASLKAKSCSYSSEGNGGLAL